MNSEMPPQAPSLNLGAIYYILFRNKWKIVLCALVGIGGAAGFYLTQKPPYQSSAKLFVRYVMSEGKSVGPAANDGTLAKSPDQRGETIISSEMEVLGSLDLARKVAETIGPARILGQADQGANLNAATLAVRTGLTISNPPLSSVINISFTHSDPELVQPVLRELIAQYLKMHSSIHRSVGMLGDFLTQETDQLRSRLSLTEDELRKARTRAGVISVEDAKVAYTEQLTSLRNQIFAARADLAAKTAVFQELSKRMEAAPAPTAAAPEAPIPPEVIDEFTKTLSRIEFLQKSEQELLTRFTEEMPRVREVRQQLEAAEAVRNKLQQEYPRLQFGASTPSRPGGQQGTMPVPSALVDVSVEINALQAKIAVLSAQMDELRAEATKLDAVEGSILELGRRQQLEEANYRYYAARLEQSRINETLGEGRVSNISEIQTPSPPVADPKKTQKTTLAIAAGGIALGLAWAFLLELILDRSVRRTSDVERLTGLPLMLHIPLTGKPRRRKKESAEEGALAIPGTGEDPLAQFHETLRDRLIASFESRNLVHKPKLVAVTALGQGAGVTTTAAGLARSLSETGEGNVLLVDMAVGQGSAQQFIRGKAVCGLDELLDARDNAHVQENLYVVAENSNNDRLSRNMPQRFSRLVPKLKASDFDYIIFDMPPVSEVSITPRLAGFMDIVLLVIESEKTDQDIVKGAAALLARSKAHVGAILNKTRTYVPPRLYQEFPHIA